MKTYLLNLKVCAKAQEVLDWVVVVWGGGVVIFWVKLKINPVFTKASQYSFNKAERA